MLECGHELRRTHNRRSRKDLWLQRWRLESPGVSGQTQRLLEAGRPSGEDQSYPNTLRSTIRRLQDSRSKQDSGSQVPQSFCDLRLSMQRGRLRLGAGMPLHQREPNFR